MIASIHQPLSKRKGPKQVKEQLQKVAKPDQSSPGGPLSSAEDQELCQYEAVIRKGWLVFLEVGFALIQIRDKRLYRKKYRSFQQYCRTEIGYGKAHAYRFIAAAETRSHIGSLGDGQEPTSERQLRPLYALEPDKVRPAWIMILEKSGDRPIEAKIVEEVAKDFLSPQKVESQGTERKVKTPNDVKRKAFKLISQIEDGFRFGCEQEEGMAWAAELRKCIEALSMKGS